MTAFSPLFCRALCDLTGVLCDIPGLGGNCNSKLRPRQKVITSVRARSLQVSAPSELNESAQYSGGQRRGLTDG